MYSRMVIFLIFIQGGGGGGGGALPIVRHCPVGYVKDIEKALELKKHINPAVKLPEKCHNFLDNFSRQEADMLPVHQYLLQLAS